ncbi:ethanolamine ammonia-lyase subunit EutC [Xanthobacter variabilis]|uniref:ethanolamine ammonia-lyase subunit EutC n=1 Tax=Xanthobacter variabilis TaxID=3119932 RepID=UPI00372BEC53
MIARDPWQSFARHTPARIALGRTGASLPTEEVLRFSLAHAQARDAVHMPFDAARVESEIRALGFDTLRVESAAPARDIYLRRPDLGRRLSDESRARLAALDALDAPPADLAIVVADGLSAAAIHAQTAPFLAALKPWIEKEGWSVAPVALAAQARVALGDEVGELMKARALVVLVGERPGLSSPDSLGLYLTLAPRVGRTDAERNCISNVRAEGLSHPLAAFKLAWHIREALRLGLTGVGLKDESDLLLVDGAPPAALPRPT